MKKLLVIAMVLLVPVAGVAQKRGGNKSQKKQAPKSDPPVSPWMEPDKDHTLKVKLLSATHLTESSSTYVSVKTHGSGNVLGATMLGFDYKSTCPGGLTANTAEESSFYEAKWKSENKKIEVLGKVEGTGKEIKCSLEVTMAAHPYRLPAPDAAAAPTAAPEDKPAAETAPAAAGDAPKTGDDKPVPPEDAPAPEPAAATEGKPAETSTPQ